MEAEVVTTFVEEERTSAESAKEDDVPAEELISCDTVPDELREVFETSVKESAFEEAGESELTRDISEFEEIP